jgi:hypothetical protein
LVKLKFQASCLPARGFVKKSIKLARVGAFTLLLFK